MKARSLREQLGERAPGWLDGEVAREAHEAQLDAAWRELTDRDGAIGWIITFIGAPFLAYGMRSHDVVWWPLPLLLAPLAAWRWWRHMVWFWRCPSCRRLTMRQVYQSSQYSVGEYPYAQYHDTLDRCVACSFERERKQLASSGGDW